MIHKILTWLKKTEPSKFGAIPRSIKENIIYDLKELGIKINAHFICKFIDNNNPIEFVKEWNNKTHKNKNTLEGGCGFMCQIREAIKNAQEQARKEAERARAEKERIKAEKERKKAEKEAKKKAEKEAKLEKLKYPFLSVLAMTVSYTHLTLPTNREV